MTPLEVLLALVVVALLITVSHWRVRAARAETSLTNLLIDRDLGIRATVADELQKRGFRTVYPEEHTDA